MNVCSVKEMQELDRAAIKEYGIPDELLMENAGLAVARVISDNFHVNGTCFAILCGGGNNGGDGLVVARALHSRGGQVRVALLGDPAKFKGAALLNYRIASRLGIPMERVADIDLLEDILLASEVVVDAIFGTGLQRPLEGLYLEAVKAVNDSVLPVVAVDIPSGINGDNGRVMGAAVEADITITFGLPKTGTLFYPGYARCGELFLSSISFPPEMIASRNIPTEINEPVVLPPRLEEGHKGSFGDVLFIAGSAGYLGAPAFSALSFLKAGGGYSRLAAPRSVVNVLGSSGSELVFHPQEETETGSLSIKNKESLLDLIKKVDLVVLGPGLSLHEEIRELVRELIPLIDKPLLLDGDGLTAAAGDTDLCAGRRAATILTPHPGEMASLCGKSIDEIMNDPLEILRQECRRRNAIIVLKGAHSLIGLPEGEVFINPSGNSGMATAGSGDVLSGTIAAMLGLGLSVEDGTRTGVFLHGLAGDLAAEELGEDGMTARDIMEALPEALSLYREEYDQIMEDCYGMVEEM